MKSVMRVTKKAIARIAFRQKKRENSLFRRYLSDQDAQVLTQHISQAVGIALTVEDIQRVAQIVRDVEEGMVGRIAGDIDDYALNYFMIIAANTQLEADNLFHGEIGVLFGGGLLIMQYALQSVHSNNWIMAIDPLDGYYRQEKDPVTGLPINIETVTENLQNEGFSMERVNLIKARSESNETLEQTRSIKLASLWIDGDHSYEGIRNDWYNYSPLVVSGGYVLIDNYHDVSWPDVSKFIDEELIPDLSGWKICTILGRSILFQKE